MILEELYEQYEELKKQKEKINNQIKAKKKHIIDNEKNIFHPKWGNLEDWEYIPQNIKKVIVGTFPSQKICNSKKVDECFFYESDKNDFWNFFGLNSKNKQDKILWCENNHVGFLDILKQCKRFGELENSKLVYDSYDCNLCYDNDDIANLNSINDNVLLICTSLDENYGPLNYLKKIGDISYDNNLGKNIKNGNLKIDNKNFKFIALPSPSRLNQKYKGREVIEETYKKYILGDD